MRIAKIQTTMPAFKGHLANDVNSMNLYKYYRANNNEDTFFKIVDIMDKKLPSDTVYRIETPVSKGKDSKNCPIWRIAIRVNESSNYDKVAFPHTEEPYKAIANLLEESVITNLFA